MASRIFFNLVFYVFTINLVNSSFLEISVIETIYMHSLDLCAHVFQRMYVYNTYVCNLLALFAYLLFFNSKIYVS